MRKPRQPHVRGLNRPLNKNVHSADVLANRSTVNARNDKPRYTLMQSALSYTTTKEVHHV